MYFVLLNCYSFNAIKSRVMRLQAHLPGLANNIHYHKYVIQDLEMKYLSFLSLSRFFTISFSSFFHIISLSLSLSFSLSLFFFSFLHNTSLSHNLSLSLSLSLLRTYVPCLYETFNYAHHPYLFMFAVFMDSFLVYLYKPWLLQNLHIHVFSLEWKV